jgi:hypothetical protein
MRLNPFAMALLGPLMPVELIMFQRIIFPIAGWLRRPQGFTPNREVSRILPLALGDFFNPAHYRRLRIRSDSRRQALKQEFICFTLPTRQGTVPLWGATLRMVFGFLGAVFDFSPPPAASLPVIQGLLHRSYTTGQHSPHHPRTGLTIGA